MVGSIIQQVDEVTKSIAENIVYIQNDRPKVSD